jgi:O-antigen ligase
MATSLFIVWAMYSWPSLTKRAQWVITVICILLGVYLHILAAKTGILSLYIFVAGYGLYLAFARRKLAGLIIILAIPLCAFFALRYIPTFRERINYIGFSYFMLRQGDKSGNIGDIARLMSYKIAGGLIKEHPVYGVGAGDMKAEMDKQYTALYPNIPEYAKLLPHNQYLTVGLGCGIPAMLLFAWWVFTPLTWLGKNRRSVFFFLTWLILFIQLMIEPVLEVQFGVFVFAFFLLLFLHEFPLFLKAQKQD